MSDQFRRRAVLFDLDGTLVDSGSDLAASINDVLNARALAPLAEADVRAMVGDGAALLVRRALEARGRPDDAGALAHFRERYDLRCLERTRPYEGIVTMLERIAEDPARRVAVVTNKPAAFAEKILDGLGLGRLVQATVGPEGTSARKPDPAHVHAALRLLDAAPGEAVMVGDGEADIASGRDAGCRTIAVLWGYRSREILLAERPDAFASDVGELEAMLGTSDLPSNPPLERR